MRDFLSLLVLVPIGLIAIVLLLLLAGLSRLALGGPLNDSINGIFYPQ